MEFLPLIDVLNPSFLLEKSRHTFVGQLLKKTGNSKKKLDKWKKGNKDQRHIFSWTVPVHLLSVAVAKNMVKSNFPETKHVMDTVKESWCLELRKSLNTMPGGAWFHMYGFLPKKNTCYWIILLMEEILHQLIGSQGYSGAGFLPSTVGSLKLTVCPWKLVANDPFLWVSAHFLGLWLLVLGRVEVQSCLINHRYGKGLLITVPRCSSLSSIQEFAELLCYFNHCPIRLCIVR